MAKIWDHLMKVLAKANPQHLVSLVLPGAIYIKDISNELQVYSKAIEPDVLYNITWEDQEAILHIEFQRRRDENMGKRAWEYNGITCFLTQLPVWTYVIYLKKDGNIVESPYQHRLPNGEVSHVFFYKNIKLWEIPKQALKQPGLEGMLPLLPLAEDGAQRAVVEEMIVELQAAQKQDLLPLAYSFAALMFEQLADRQWLHRRFEMLHDILEESWAYQEMFEEATTKGFQHGLEKGLERGLERGLEQGTQQALSHYIEMRFPALVPLFKAQISNVKDAELLQRLLFDLFAAQDEKQAESMILNIYGQQE